MKMNKTIEAAKKWYAETYPLSTHKSVTNEWMLESWIQEVTNPWWLSLSEERRQDLFGIAGDKYDIARGYLELKEATPLVPKEEPVSPDPATLFAESFNDITIEDAYFAQSCFRSGADYQKEQDKLLIQELRDALKTCRSDLFGQLSLAFGADTASCDAAIIDAKTAITKADNYLKGV